MEQTKITFIINGKTFSLSAANAEAVRAIPSAERQQLIALLESVKQQELQSQVAVQQALDRARVSSRVVPELSSQGPRPERMGGGDVDALMARLVMEENRNKKPALTRQDLYKWIAGGAGIVALLLLIF